jgi:hypothetical protein
MLPDGLQLPGSRHPITYSKLLLVEGQDAFQFFKALLRYLRLLDEIEIRNFGGVDDLAEYLRTLTATPGFSDVTSLGIIQDAELSLDTTFQSVCNSLRKAGFSEPQQLAVPVIGKPNVSVFILPDCSNPGMLETLCLQAVSSDPVMSCIDQYLQCVQDLAGTEPSNPSKAYLHTFLASRPEPGLLLGQAAHRNYLPWDSLAFNDVKQFIQTL